MTKQWLEHEILFLKNNYEEYGAAYCSKKLNKSKDSVAHKANRMGLVFKKENGWKYSKEEIEQIVQNSFSYSDALRNMRIQPNAANFVTIKNYIKRYNVSISHFLSRKELYKKNVSNNSKKPIEYYLVNGQNQPSNFKKRLYDEGLKKEECEICGQKIDWFGRKLTLILDHINGNHYDNRIENLRIVCPNCDSTLDTYCYRNIKRNDMGENVCVCGEKKDKKAKLCKKCYNSSRRKTLRPTYEQLKKDIDEIGYVSTGKKYGVSDNSIRKWIKNYNL